MTLSCVHLSFNAWKKEGRNRKKIFAMTSGGFVIVLGNNSNNFRAYLVLFLRPYMACLGILARARKGPNFSSKVLSVLLPINDLTRTQKFSSWYILPLLKTVK
jgi:hypothetical protein